MNLFYFYQLASLKKKQEAAPFMTHEKAMRKQERELSSLNPVFAALVKSVLTQLNAKGWQSFVFQGKTRTPQQAAENVSAKLHIALLTSSAITRGAHAVNIQSADRVRLGDE